MSDTGHERYTAECNQREADLKNLASGREIKELQGQLKSCHAMNIVLLEERLKFVRTRVYRLLCFFGVI
jgi:hypothetical protein